MQARKLVAPAVLGALIVSGISPALADDGDERDEVDGFEVEVDRPTVMLGDEVEIEIEFERKLDDESGEDDEDGDDERGSKGRGRGGDDTDDADEGDDADDATDDLTATEDTSAPAETEDGTDDGSDGEDGTDEGATDPEPVVTGLPTTVSFTVDFGDGSGVQELTPDELEADEEEFEAEAEISHTYTALGDYELSVTAMPDVGEPVTVTATVTVTDEPVPYGRKTTEACPEGLTVPESFKDVRPGSPHKAMVDCLATRGLIRGRSSEQFNPSENVSRAQMASFLVRLLEEAGIEVPETPEDAFDDDEGNTHEESINQLAALGLLSGDDGEVKPNGKLTRDQMASLLVRVLELAGVTVDTGLDYFGDDEGSVHEDAINRAAAAGITTGRQLGEYGPREKLTREQLATFLARALDLLVVDAAEGAETA